MQGALLFCLLVQVVGAAAVILPFLGLSEPSILRAILGACGGIATIGKTFLPGFQEVVIRHSYARTLAFISGFLTLCISAYIAREAVRDKSD